MDKKELQKLFNESPADCVYSADWCRYLNPIEMENVFREQSKEFREFWNNKIMDDSYKQLSDFDMDPIIVFFDNTARNSREFKEKGGVAAAKANLRQTQWHEILRGLKDDREKREILHKIFLEENDDTLIDLLNELEVKNHVNKIKGLTSYAGVALNAFLCTYNPDKYLTMLHFNHRFKLINFFKLGDIYEYISYGEKIIKTRNDIIVGFKDNFGIETTPFQLSFFIYCKLIDKYGWSQER